MQWREYLKQLASQADGTARAIRVGRPQLVGETTLTKVPKNRAQTRTLPPWVGTRTLNGEILVL